MQSWWLRLNEVQLYFINISKINDAVELKKMFKWHRWTQCDWTSSLKEQLHLSYMGVLCLFVCTWSMKKTHNTTVKSKKFMWYKLCAENKTTTNMSVFPVFVGHPSIYCTQKHGNVCVTFTKYLSSTIQSTTT